MTYHLCAEWQQQSAIVVCWPPPNSDWQPMLKDIEASYIELIDQMTKYIPVICLCQDSVHLAHVRRRLNKQDSTKIHLLPIPCNDIWLRDFGPLTISNGKSYQHHNFAFNAWGNKYPHELDRLACERLLQTLSLPYENHAFVLEGGALDTDGQGKLLTTTQCLLNPNRNGETDKAQLQQQLSKLGITETLWCDQGLLHGDDTDSHIDMLARFISTEHICYQACDDPDDPHYLHLQALAVELTAFRDNNKRPYQLTALPWPKAQFDSGRRLPLSYANFVITPEAVFVPIYQCERDQEALSLLKDCFAKRAVIGIDARQLIRQNGSLHCATMQLYQPLSL